MRILTLTTIYPNERRDSEGRSVAFLDRALAGQGVQGSTLVLLPWAPQWLAKRTEKWRLLAVRNRVEKVNGVMVIFAHYLHLPRHFRLDVSARLMAARAISLVKKHGLHFDLVHGQSIYPAALAASLLAKKYGIPFIITLRDHLDHHAHLLAQSGPALREMYADMFRRVRAIMVHGPALQRDVPRYLPGDRDVPVFLAPNGVDLEGLESMLNTMPPLEDSSSGRKIVSVGNLYRYKGIHENLWALKLLDAKGLRDWFYTVVGDGPYRRELESLAAELGIHDRVRFAGRLSHFETIRAMRAADILSLPSWMEPFGNVYAEAAVCGKPVIGCRGMGAEVTVRHGETGMLVPPKDIEALAASLEYLLSHPEEAAAMGRYGREHIRQFTWEKTAALYREVMARSLSPAP
jgi:teichuronic acid biosynthesis glycosyltransferase TuaC